MLHVLKVHIITYVYYKCFYECHYVFLLHITFYTTCQRPIPVGPLLLNEWMNEFKKHQYHNIMTHVLLFATPLRSYRASGQLQGRASLCTFSDDVTYMFTESWFVTVTRLEFWSMSRARDRSSNATGMWLAYMKTLKTRSTMPSAMQGRVPSAPPQNCVGRYICPHRRGDWSNQILHGDQSGWGQTFTGSTIPRP